MHIYAFGSICRGEISPESDIDLLAIVDGNDVRFDPNIYSIYSYKRINEIWHEGNPFAWHLSLEAKLLYSPDKSDYLCKLGNPSLYKDAKNDCQKFLTIFKDAQRSISDSKGSSVLDLSIIFLSIRNIATCFSLGSGNEPVFSRHSATKIGINSITVKKEIYHILERSRLLCTRGVGPQLSENEISLATSALNDIEAWMNKLVEDVNR